MRQGSVATQQQVHNGQPALKSYFKNDSEKHWWTRQMRTRHLLSASDSASGPACHAEWSARDTGSWHCLPCGEASLHNPKARQTGRKDVFEVIMAKYGLAWGFFTPPSFLWLVILTPTMFLQLKRIKSLYVDFHRNPGPILGKNSSTRNDSVKRWARLHGSAMTKSPGTDGVCQPRSPHLLCGLSNVT